MQPLSWIVVGLIAGLLARVVVRDEKSGCVYTIVVGILGGLIGGALASAAGTESINELSVRSIAIAFVGACLLLLVLQALGGRNRGRNRR